jgi:hypothetical protein
MGGNIYNSTCSTNNIGNQTCNNTCTGAKVEYNWDTVSTLNTNEFNQFLTTNNAENLPNCTSMP